MQDENEQYQRAKARVRRIRSFYSSLLTFVLVNLLLMILNFVTNPRHLWFWWVTLIWGFVLLIQAFNVFTIKDHFLGEEWEKRKIKDLMDKENQENRNKPEGK